MYTPGYQRHFPSSMRRGVSVIIRAVIFDMDGVLVDSEPLDQEAWVQVLSNHGIKALRSDFEGLTGKSTESVLEYFETRSRLKLDNSILDEKRKLFYSYAKSRLKAMMRVEHCVQTLKEHGFLLAVASSSDRERIRFSLSRTGLDKYFEATCSAEEVSLPKPAPDVYLRAAAKLGVLPETCVAVEDSIHGISAAVAARMTCYGYASSFSDSTLRANGAVAVFSDYDELTKHLVQLKYAQLQ